MNKLFLGLILMLVTSFVFSGVGKPTKEKPVVKQEQIAVLTVPTVNTPIVIQDETSAFQLLVLPPAPACMSGYSNVISVNSDGSAIANCLSNYGGGGYYNAYLPCAYCTWVTQ